MSYSNIYFYFFCLIYIVVSIYDVQLVEYENVHILIFCIPEKCAPSYYACSGKVCTYCFFLLKIHIFYMNYAWFLQKCALTKIFRSRKVTHVVALPKTQKCAHSGSIYWESMISEYFWTYYFFVLTVDTCSHCIWF